MAVFQVIRCVGKMKKVNIITILDNFNFGTYLQAFATAKTVQDLGYKAEIIAYNRPGTTVWSHYIRSLKTTYNPLKWLARTLYALREASLKKKDLSFVSQYLSSKRYYSFNDLKYDVPIADIYMTGSDQVWNSFYNHGIDKSFYLDFVPNGKKRIAYAASIGMKNIPIEEQEPMKLLLSKYDMITVREESSIKILSDIGVDTERIKVVLDPTLLLDKKCWERYACKRLVKEQYLLVYSVEDSEKNKEVAKIAMDIARLRNLKIIGVYYGGKSTSIPGCDKNFFYSTPDIFLSLLLYASFVVVSSFHGTAFSVNFMKEFVVVSPDKFNSRITNLLALLKIENRQVVSAKNDISILKTLDYENIHRILENERVKSLQILKLMIN